MHQTSHPMTSRDQHQSALPTTGQHRPLLLAVFAVLALSTALPGHDGGFGHSRRTIFLAARPDELVLEYRIVQNRDDALLEMTLMDRDGDGQVSQEEKDRYFQDRARLLAESLHCRTPGGQAIALKFIGYELQQALVQVFHFRLTTSEKDVLLDDRNFSHKPGLVQVRHGSGLTVELARPVDLSHAERINLRIKRTPQPKE
jgi:hypothetical protein